MSSSYTHLDVESRSSISTCPKRHKLLFYVLLTSIASFVVGCLVGSFFSKTKNGMVTGDKFEELSSSLQTQVREDFIRSQLLIYSSDIHQAGSEKNLELANMMLDNWKKWGMANSSIFNYSFNKTIPNDKWFSNITIYHVDGLEASIEIPTSEINGKLLRYHSYSSSGSANGSFVFVNYGLLSDLDILKQMDISFCGSNVIVIARLGYSFRTAKVKNLVKVCGKNNLPGGLLIYPDPWDYAVDSDNPYSTPSNTPVFPNSWWLPENAAIFGNMKMKAGLQSSELPSMNGIFNTVPFSDMQTPFPVQPISYKDAKIIFSKMDQHEIPESWNRSIAKYIKSSPLWEIEMNINNDVIVSKLANVIGLLPGYEEPDRYVILGNHRDAWVYGTSDPGSGTAILQTVVSILAQAYKSGKFKPRRTIIFANWDGEEEGLLGSSEFVAQFSEELSKRAIAYVNMDCPIKGNWSFNARSTPLLESAVIASSKNVYVNSDLSLYKDWFNKYPNKNATGPQFNDLGGGSDHIHFTYVLGIPGFYPEYKFHQFLPSMPAYHSQYDNMDMMMKYVDEGLHHHALLSRFVLDYMIRLSSSSIVPFDTQVLANRMITELPALIKRITQLYLYQYEQILIFEVYEFKKAANQFQEFIEENYKSIINNSTELRRINDILLELPRSFIVREGLPTRYIYRNILLSTKITNSYLGSFYTGVYDAVYLYGKNRVSIETVYRQLSLLINSIRVATRLLKGGFIGNLNF